MEINEKGDCPVCKNGTVGQCVCESNIDSLARAGKKLLKGFNRSDAKGLLTEYLLSPLAGRPTQFIKSVYAIK